MILPRYTSKNPNHIPNGSLYANQSSRIVVGTESNTHTANSAVPPAATCFGYRSTHLSKIDFRGSLLCCALCGSTTVDEGAEWLADFHGGVKWNFEWVVAVVLLLWLLLVSGTATDAPAAMMAHVLHAIVATPAAPPNGMGDTESTSGAGRYQQRTQHGIRKRKRRLLFASNAVSENSAVSLEVMA